MDKTLLLLMKEFKGLCKQSNVNPANRSFSDVFDEVIQNDSSEFVECQINFLESTIRNRKYKVTYEHDVISKMLESLRQRRGFNSRLV